MSDAASLVIGLDLGTTSTKAVAFAVDGTQVATASHGYSLDTPHPGYAVQDPEAILAAALAATADVVAAVGAERIAGISFSSAMHSLLALDALYRPLTPVVTWGDTRADVQAERLRARVGGLELHRRTGTPLHPMSPLPKLLWYREVEPKLHESAAFWAGIKDWVLVRMCGALVIDHSLASATGLMNIHTLDWDDEALSIAGVSPEQLPELVRTRHILPNLTEEAALATGLPVDTRVVVGAGDGPLANLGIGAVRPGVAACSIGTSAALRVAVDKPAVDPQGGVFCYALTEDRWVIGGAINNGGATLEWVRHLLAPELGDGDETELLELAARAQPGSGGLLMLPYLLSERAPHWSALPKGAFIGLTRAHSREHLIRAALEGVCLQLALVLQSMRDAGLEITQVRATGGATSNPLWREVLASALDMRVDFAEGQEGSSFGAALLGMDALGLIASIDVAADLIPIQDSMSPNPVAAAVYRRMQPLFAELYDQLVPTFSNLRRLAQLLPIALVEPD
ncbi:gluconokinase [Microbacterium sp. P05]|uniref:gluconokinase n=1 Tax=Microbacterium sp. P05 TaxID=3366948 RepID=UPI003746A9BE